MQTDVDVLFPDVQEVKVREEVFVIKPLEWGEFKEVTKAIQGVKLSVNEAGDIDFISTISNHGDEITDIIALCTHKPKDWVEKLALDHIIALSAAIFKVNRDFFSQTILPILQKSMESLQDGAK